MTQKTITKKDVEDQPDDAEAVMIPSQVSKTNRKSIS